ncbi:MAG TPA: hypothetical protein VIW29_11425 [Polyangiaceae bacterium]
MLPVYLSCTSDQDTEPFVPALPGATQPVASGSLLSEGEACERLLEAATSAYAEHGCELEHAECPDFIRSAGASGCYEYQEESVEECESSYAAATSCSNLAPCFVTAIENTSLPECELVAVPGEGGAPGSAGGAPGSDGGTPGSDGGTPGSSGASTQMGGASGGQPVVVGGAGGAAP